MVLLRDVNFYFSFLTKLGILATLQILQHMHVCMRADMRVQCAHTYTVHHWDTQCYTRCVWCHCVSHSCIVMDLYNSEYFHFVRIRHIYWGVAIFYFIF